MKKHIHNKIKELHADQDRVPSSDSPGADFFSQMQESVLSRVGIDRQSQPVPQDFFADMQESVLSNFDKKTELTVTRRLPFYLKVASFIALLAIMTVGALTHYQAEPTLMADNVLEDQELLLLVDEVATEDELESIILLEGGLYDEITEDALEHYLEEELNLADEDLLQSLM